MTAFPEAPRRPTWKRSLRVRWPLAAAGVALVATGLVVADRAVARDVAIGFAVLPGIALAMIWLRGVVRFRVLLTSGALTPQISNGVRRTFHDAEGREHAVRGAEVDGAPVAVVFDPANPREHRPVTPADFVVEADA